MRILVVGSGGREHALVWQLRRSPRVREVFCAPGNGGIQRDASCCPVSVMDLNGIASLVQSERIDCVLVGPEAPLAAGLVDHLQSLGIPAVGPRSDAARLESSKVFAKEFMARHGVPTAGFAVYRSAQEAISALDSRETRYPLVVKADGLAAGKGVVIARTREEAREAIERTMIEREFGAAGDLVVLEEFLEGKEASFIVFTDGKAILPAVAARDHKAAYDHDKGPNTGGMGAYSIDSILQPEVEKEVMERVVLPVINGMRTEGSTFQGMLYTGLMLTAAGPRVLEFNVRMGDPEGQVIMPRLQSDFAALCEALCQGRLKEYKAVWNQGAAVCIVLASGGYPGAYARGKIISGLRMAEEDPRIVVFHAGTRREEERFVTDGGRVVGVTAVADELASAVMSAYEAVNKIHFDGMHYRRDIGARELGTMDSATEGIDA